MKTGVKLLLIIVSVLIVHGCFQMKKKSNPDIWPTCLAKFCFKATLPELEILTRTYGNGASKTFLEDTYHCYYDNNQQRYITFIVHNNVTPFIHSILVTRTPNCDDAQSPVIPFNEIKTGEGIGITDRYERLIKIYGEPIAVKKGQELKEMFSLYFPTLPIAIDADYAIAYGPNKNDMLLETWFFIKDEHVTAIFLSNAE